MNIRNYIDDVNSYHRKVIDKNNTTKQKIEEIFAAVHSVDASYGTTFNNLETNLSELNRFVKELSEIVEPGKGRFDGQYISTTLEPVIKDISAANVQTIRDSFVQTIGGEPVYDEEQILDYIKKNPGQMTSDEKEALLGVICELQDTVAFYEYAAMVGSDNMSAAFLNRASWVSETEKFSSFSAASAHYNDLYVNILEGCIEQSKDKNTFAAALLEVSNGKSTLDVLGVECSENVSKILRKGFLITV